MSEQLPKTPRQLGTEAESLYSDHKSFARRYDRATAEVAEHTELAQLHEGIRQAIYQGKKTYYANGRGGNLGGESSDQHFEFRNEQLKKLGDAVLDQGYSLEDLRTNNRQAARHYKRNAEGYHDLAVLEAQLDGVQINVSQPEESPEQIEVKVQK